MLTMQLERSWKGHGDQHVGPVEGLRIVGTSLRVLPEDAEILQFSGDQWRGEDDSFLALVIDSPTFVEVESPQDGATRRYGPFEHIRVVYGAIRTSKDSRRTLARFQEGEGLWHVYPDQTDWPNIAFVPAAD